MFNNKKSVGSRARRSLAIVIAVMCFYTARTQTFTYRQFIDTLLEHNKELAAEKLNTEAGKAEIDAAKVWQDPELSVEYGNNSDWSIAMGRSIEVGLSMSFSLGKISARTRLARKSLVATKAELYDYFWNLYADASILFLDAMLARDLAAISRETWQNDLSLAMSDSLRYVRGEIAELDMLQSRLEAHLAHQEWMSRVTEYSNLLSRLDAMAGVSGRGTIGVEGELVCPDGDYDLQTLLDRTMISRADLLAARAGADVSRQEVKVASRERIPDINLSVGVSHNSEVRNEIAPAPEFVGYTVGLGIPLPISNLNRGSIRVAQLKAMQSLLRVEALESEVRSDVVCAYNNYQTARNRAKSYTTTLMDNARKVFEGKMYAYSRGESSLLEVISAQRTYNEVRQAHSESLHESMVALIELQRATY